MAIILRKFQHQSGPTTHKKPQVVSANMEDAVNIFQCVNFHGTYCIMEGRLDQTDENDTVTRPKKKYPGGPLTPQEERRMDPHMSKGKSTFISKRKQTLSGGVTYCGQDAMQRCRLLKTLYSMYIVCVGERCGSERVGSLTEQGSGLASRAHPGWISCLPHMKQST
jgi:hypothetical protein